MWLHRSSWAAGVFGKDAPSSAVEQSASSEMRKARSAVRQGVRQMQSASPCCTASRASPRFGSAHGPRRSGRPAWRRFCCPCPAGTGNPARTDARARWARRLVHQGSKFPGSLPAVAASGRRPRDRLDGALGHPAPPWQTAAHRNQKSSMALFSSFQRASRVVRFSHGEFRIGWSRISRLAASSPMKSCEQGSKCSVRLSLRAQGAQD